VTVLNGQPQSPVYPTDRVQSSRRSESVLKIPSQTPCSPRDTTDVQGGLRVPLGRAEASAEHICEFCWPIRVGLHHLINRRSNAPSLGGHKHDEPQSNG
jgi:hypothetical protein